MATIISELQAKLTLKNKSFLSSLEGSQQALKGFGNSIDDVNTKLDKIENTLKHVAAAATAAAATYKLAEAMGILYIDTKNAADAFFRFGDKELLENLRLSTAGMVSDLRLMQLSVQAVNLSVSQNDLATYFEFSTIRAAETGKEVEALVDNIVSGIGRESSRVIDNLGISQVRLNEEIKKTVDFELAVSNIITEELGKSKKSVDELASGFVQVTVAATNFLTVLSSGQTGEAMNNFGKDIATVIDGLSSLTNWLGSGGFAAFVALEPVIAAVVWQFRKLADVIEYFKDPPKQVMPEWIDDILNPKLPEGELGPVFGTGVIEPDIVYDFSKAKKKFEEAYDNWIVDLCNATNEVLCGDQGDAIELWDHKNSTNAMKAEISMIEELMGHVEAGGEAWKAYKAELEDVKKLYDQLTQSIVLNNESVTEETSSMYEYAQSLSTVSMNLVNAGTALASSLNSGQSSLASLGNFVSQIASFMVEFGVLLVAFGVAQEALYAGDVYTKIAAGLALAGLAIAIAGSLSNITSSASGGSQSSRTATYGGGMGYDYNREIVMVARGEDLVGVIERQNHKTNING